MTQRLWFRSGFPSSKLCKAFSEFSAFHIGVKELGPVTGSFPKYLGEADNCTFCVCVCVCRYSTVCWYLGPQGQPDPAECSGVFVGSCEESFCIHPGGPQGACPPGEDLAFGVAGLQFLKTNPSGRVWMSFCSLSLRRRLQERENECHEVTELVGPYLGNRVGRVLEFYLGFAHRICKLYT